MSAENEAHQGPYRDNHYVPEWFQRRFLLQDQSRYFYHDLYPDLIRDGAGRPIRDGSGIAKTRRATLNWGPSSCFKQIDLYTGFMADGSICDALERELFGRIDGEASKIFDRFIAGDAIEPDGQVFLDFLNGQLVRTPKGLDWLIAEAKKSDDPVNSRDDLLDLMQDVRRAHVAMIAEGVWEIVSACSSKTKFILSDHPVTRYHPKWPSSIDRVRNSSDPDFFSIGTRIVFPLDLEHCLIVTHREAFDPARSRSLKRRTNARAFADARFPYGAILRGRQLAEQDVAVINLMIKQGAKRYIAAACRTWLFPENSLQRTRWHSLLTTLQPGPSKDLDAVLNTTKILWTPCKIRDPDEIQVKGTDVLGRPLATDDADLWEYALRKTMERLGEKKRVRGEVLDPKRPRFIIGPGLHRKG